MKASPSCLLLYRPAVLCRVRQGLQRHHDNIMHRRTQQTACSMDPVGVGCSFRVVVVDGSWSQRGRLLSASPHVATRLCQLLFVRVWLYDYISLPGALSDDVVAWPIFSRAWDKQNRHLLPAFFCSLASPPAGFTCCWGQGVTAVGGGS